MEQQVFYYTFNHGSNGGVVIATSLEQAYRKVFDAYKIYGPSISVEVWPANEDDAWNAKHPDVHERY